MPVCLKRSANEFRNGYRRFKACTYSTLSFLEISIGQLIGLVLLIVPAIPKRFKEWAYVGFGIMYISALVAHIAVGDPFVPYGLMAVLFFGLLLASYISFHKLQAAK